MKDQPVEAGSPEVLIADQPDPEFLYMFPFEFDVTLIVPSALIADPKWVPPTFELDQSAPELSDVYTHPSSRAPATHLEPLVLVAKELKLGPYPAQR
jgi:hypothetical protein